MMWYGVVANNWGTCKLHQQLMGGNPVMALGGDCLYCLSVELVGGEHYWPR